MPRVFVAAVLVVVPACVHTVPVRIGSDDSIAFVDDSPSPARFPGGEPAPVAKDWELVVATKDGQFTGTDAPLTLVHRDDTLHVRGHEDDLGKSVELSYPDAQIQRIWLERPNVGGTVALIAVGTVLWGRGAFGS
jgi:hypothetical protein